MAKKNQVDFYSGFGKFVDNKTVDINGAQISAQNFIIATGSKPKSLSNINSNSDKIVYSKDIFSMDTLPASLTIIGAGAIGAEFAYFFSSFGTEVTLIEAEDRILPNEDKEISTWLEKAFKKRKWFIFNFWASLCFKYKKNYYFLSLFIKSSSWFRSE